MKKAVWLLLLAMLLACGPSTTNTQPAAVDEEEETAVTNTEEATEETAETNDEPTASSGVEATNLDDFSPAGTVEEAAVVREQDWRKGTADPDVVIIEYGDFQ
jgi:hypothetical protein